MDPWFSLALVLLPVSAAGTVGPWLVDRLVGVDYPELAQQARIEGTVELKCHIDSSGHVADCQPIAGHPILQKAAIENAGKWQWRPNSDGDPRADTLSLRYEFKLIGSGVRGRPKVEFSFENPNIVRVVSEIPCIDHAPCTPHEIEQAGKKHSSTKRSNLEVAK